MSAALELGVPLVSSLNSGAFRSERSVWDDPRLQPQPERIPGSQIGFFAALWIVIGAVSAYDTYLTVRYQETLVLLERNPIALWLLAHDNWNPATLVGLKFLGSMMVLGVLGLSFWWKPRWGITMSLSIALFQGALLAFLSL